MWDEKMITSRASLLAPNVFLRRVVWECREQDLNLHDLAATSPSSWRVCQFRHLGSGLFF
jgi:hypothetical protein